MFPSSCQWLRGGVPISWLLGAGRCLSDLWSAVVGRGVPISSSFSDCFWGSMYSKLLTFQLIHAFQILH